MPSTRALMTAATLRALARLGGTAAVSQIENAVYAEVFGGEEIETPPRWWTSLRPTLSYIRTDLQRAGVIKNVRHGQWQLQAHVWPVIEALSHAPALGSEPSYAVDHRAEYVEVSGEIRIELHAPASMHVAAAFFNGFQQVIDRVARQLARETPSMPEAWFPGSGPLVELEIDELWIGSLGIRVRPRIRRFLVDAYGRDCWVDLTRQATVAIARSAVSAGMIVIGAIGGASLRGGEEDGDNPADVGAEVIDLVKGMREAGVPAWSATITSVTAGGELTITVQVGDGAQADGAVEQR